MTAGVGRADAVRARLAAAADGFGDWPAYSDRDGPPVETLTWAQTQQAALELAAG